LRTATLELETGKAKAELAKANADIASANAEIAEANKQTASLEKDAAEARRDLAAANARAAEANQKAEAEQKDAAEVRRDVAAANARAAEANQKAEAERLERLKLELPIAPQDLAGQPRSELVALFRSFGAQSVDVFAYPEGSRPGYALICANDNRCIYGGGVASAVLDSDWRSRGRNRCSGSHTPRVRRIYRKRGKFYCARATPWGFRSISMGPAFHDKRRQGNTWDGECERTHLGRERCCPNPGLRRNQAALIRRGVKRSRVGRGETHERYRLPVKLPGDVC